ncbi:expressed unknown protein [Seminavis robusta]|uniref:F-box domain-containing protein n=1 Tax=Seminavis robusta TaxID=568900 RepID=A0A9N8DW57_9STRA|nr:expressed unknown protein [Seminavis robusta]|eukprot:Sro420_g139210.1 n/a (427) ;mRNA; f:95-1375
MSSRAGPTGTGTSTGILEGLSEDLLLKIFGHVNVLDLRVAACVCQHWNSVIKPLDLGLLMVTVSGSNELALLSSSSSSSNTTRNTGSSSSAVIQRFAASPNHRKRKRFYHTRQAAGPTAYQWPTCLAVGPQKQLYLSQYKVQGVLEFRPCREGYQYRRTLASGRNLASPEGLVVAYNSLYVVSVQNATISRLSLKTGALLERAGPAQGMNDFWTLWGMTISPCQRYLLIAGHVSDEGDYRQPTDTPTGAILRLDIDPTNGSFQRNPQRHGTIMGYYAIPAPPSLALNRPSDPQYCRHGILHVSTFAPNASGGRRIQKFSLLKQQINNHEEELIRHWGWLQEADHFHPWGIAFSNKTDQVFLTSTNHASTSNVNGGQVLRLPTCGCHHLDLASNDTPPRAISCGNLTALVDGQHAVLNQPNYVLSID